MKISPRQKKWLKRLAILLLLRVVLGGLLYYVIVYRFKDILQVAVKRESKGLYSFDAEDIDVALFRKNITLNNIRLKCIDTSQQRSHYDVQVPQIYLSIESFKDLILHKKLGIDSMAVIMPQVTAHIKEKKRSSQLSFEASKFMDALQKVVLHLQVRTFKIQDASFSYYNDQLAKPFKGSNISLEVSNFSQKDKIRDYLFSADDVDLLITNQHWELPDGAHEIFFRKLHFSGKNQLFELDTCSFTSHGDENQHSLELKADRIFFNSTRLQDIYQKEELSIDTISFLRPLLTVQSATKKNSDSTAIAGAMHKLLNKMTFKFIDIKDGEFSFGRKSGLQKNYQTEKTNLQMYNLAIYPGQKKSLTVDSINLSLTNLVLYTRDSLNQLKIGAFVMNKDQLSLRNAEFGPTSINENPNSVRFSTRLLNLEKVSLDELLKKRLVGTVARLHHPVFNVISGKKITARTETEIGVKDFFRTLNSIRELIEVDSFRIIQGELNYRSLKNNLVAKLQGLNSTALINQLLRSDSLLDVKRSLPEFSVASVNIRNPKLNLQVDNYRFEGIKRNGRADRFVINTGAGRFSGKGIYWNRFNWDVYAKQKLLDISYINLDELTADISRSKKAAPSEAKDIPALIIGHLEIGRLNFALETVKDGRLNLTGKNIFLDQLQSEGEFMRWDHVTGNFNDLTYQTKTVTATAATINIDNQKKNSVYNTRVSTSNGDMVMDIPALHLVTDFHSTDISNPGIRSLILEKPLVTLNVGPAKARQESDFKVPLDLEAQLLEIRDGSIQYADQKDSSQASATLNLQLLDFSAKQGLGTIRASGATFNLQKIAFQKSSLVAGMDSALIELNKLEVKANGQRQAQISAGVSLKWIGANAQVINRDSSDLALTGFDGNFVRKNLRWSKGEKLMWTDLLKDANVTRGRSQYQSANLTAAAGNLSWNGKNENLHIDDFSVLPKLSMEEAFEKALWQSDYQSVKGASLDVKGIRLTEDGQDTILHADKILLNKIDLITARDKRLPLKRGVEKLMPTQLINNIKYPFEIDSVVLTDSKVEVHEYSTVTNQKGIIPLEQVNAIITNVKSKSRADDSLRLVADARVLNNYINNLRYSESYRDSLSSFSLHFHASPMIFSSFSKATRPLASVMVEGGNSDTLYADWVGNKYAAIGKMNFVYKGLAVRLLDKKNPGRRSFVLGVINFLANRVILRRRNHRESIVFFERDPEKFVFNYWVKTSLNGLMSSVGLKSRRKVLKQFAKKEFGLKLER